MNFTLRVAELLFQIPAMTLATCNDAKTSFEHIVSSTSKHKATQATSKHCKLFWVSLRLPAPLTTKHLDIAKKQRWWQTQHAPNNCKHQQLASQDSCKRQSWNLLLLGSWTWEALQHVFQIPGFDACNRHPFWCILYLKLVGNMQRTNES